MLRGDHHEFSLGRMKFERPVTYIGLYNQVGKLVDTWTSALKTE